MKAAQIPAKSFRFRQSVCGTPAGEIETEPLDPLNIDFPLDFFHAPAPRTTAKWADGAVALLLFEEQDVGL